MSIYINETTSNRKVIKNPFAKIHQAAIDNGGSLSDTERKKMMREAIEKLNNIKLDKTTNKNDTGAYR